MCDNINQGIDYINFMRNNDEVGLLSAIQSRILEDERVTNVTFESSKENGKLKIILKITSGDTVSFEI